MCSSSKKKKPGLSIRRRRYRCEELEGLPDEMMYLIIEKLMMVHSPIDLARFSAVCKRWHRLVCDAWPKLLHHQITTPLVLIPIINRRDSSDRTATDDDHRVSCQIYNFVGDRTLALPSPSSYLNIIGSSFGWLIVHQGINKKNNKSIVSLFNPLSKSRIQLPPLRATGATPRLVKGVLSNPPPPRPRQTGSEDQHFDIAITMNPSNSRIFYKSATMIAFLHVDKIGELESLRWVYHHCTNQDDDPILDVNTIGGKICILYANGFISCCNCSTDRFSYSGVTITAWPSGLDGNHLAAVYLLESSSLLPLAVFRYIVSYYKGSRPPDVGFKILTLTSSDEEINEFNKAWNWNEDKANAGSPLLNWTEIKTLGNDVIFLDDNTSIYIQAADGRSKLHQTAGSIIYLPNEYGCFYLTNQEIDIGVFNVDKSCLTNFTHHRLDDTELLRRPPIWLMPSYSQILKFSNIG